MTRDLCVVMAMLTITKAQNDQTFVVRAGERLAVQLPENPSTGYTWAFVCLDQDLVEIEESSYGGAGPGVGSGGLETWTLRARSPGKTRIELKLMRSWEGDASIVDRFSVALDIETV